MTKPDFIRTVKPKFKTRYDNYIGGAWMAPTSGRYFENPSPVNGEILCEIARSDAADVEKALDAAHAAKDAWGKTSVAERAVILNAIAQRMEDNLPMLAEAESWDNGKPIRETTAADLPLAIDHFRYFAGAIRAQEGGISEIDHDTVAYHFHEPLGVVGQIIPWNFPLLMATWKLAPALAAGNCVVIKPAEQTPASILVLAELIGELLPAGVLNIVNGFGLEAGQAARLFQPHRQDRLHGRDHHRPPDYAVRQPEPDPGHAGARRQVAQHLLQGRDGRRRRLPRQGAGRLRHVRAQSGRGLHLPQPRPCARGHLRRLHGKGRQAGRGHQAGRSPRSHHHDRALRPPPNSWRKS